MYIHNGRFKQLYRLFFLFVCEAGIILQYAGMAGKGDLRMLTAYYTVLSNILCFIYFAVLVIAQRKKENALIRGAVTMCITVTGLVYHFMLGGFMGTAAGAGVPVTALSVSNILVHYVVPILVILDYFLFVPKGQYKSLYPLAWLVLPYAYFAFSMVRAEVSTRTFTGFGATSRYPYPFLDVDLYGWDKVLLIVLAVTVAFIALGYIVYVLDRLLGKNLSTSRKRRD